VGSPHRLRRRQQRPGHGHHGRALLGRAGAVQARRRVPDGERPRRRQ
jgi:hypothetical protein